MRSPGALLLLAVLAGCANPAPALIAGHPQPPNQVDTKSEYITYLVPHGSKIGSVTSSSEIQMVDYIKADQSLQNWTDMITVIIGQKKTENQIDAYYKSSAERRRSDCAVEPVTETPTRFREGSYSAGIRMVACGETRKFGWGEIFFEKVIEGRYGLYVMLRTWKYPPVSQSRNLVPTDQMRDTATTLLASFRLCDRSEPRPECPTGPGTLLPQEAALPGQ